MNGSLISTAVVLLITASHCVLAVESEIDRQAWGIATSKYIADYPKNEVRSYRTTPDSFKHVKNFKEKALDHAKATKVLPIVNWGNIPSSEPQTRVHERTYFTSIIQPGHQLHREMGLRDDMVSLAFWKHEDGKFHLLYLDTLNRAPVEWHLEPLERILQHH